MSWLKIWIISLDLDCLSAGGGWTCKDKSGSLPTRVALTARLSRRACAFSPWLAPEWIKPNQIPTELPPPPGERHSLTHVYNCSSFGSSFGMWSCHWQSDEQCKKNPQKTGFFLFVSFFSPAPLRLVAKFLQKCTHPSTSNSKQPRGKNNTII